MRGIQATPPTSRRWKPDGDFVKLAYFVKPHLGGTYTVFRQLRKGLRAHGIEVEWMGLSHDAREATAWTDTSENGVLLHTESCSSEKQQAEAMLAALHERGFDGVFVNVLADRVQMNLARYLPAHMLRIMIVHNITPGTYAAARALRDHVHATVGVSQRCRRDLVVRHGFPVSRTFAIPNALEVEEIADRRRRREPAEPLRVLYLGRVEDASKGVFWLPDIMAAITEPVTLTVAGDGPDLEALKTRLAPHAARTSFVGAVSPDQVPETLASHDVLLMPSRFEGFGLTLLEAMAAGCVPVVSDIAGVTDTIAENDVSGILFPIGDWRAAARSIDELGRNPERLATMSVAARHRVADKFGLKRMAGSYARLIEDMAHQRPTIALPLPMDEWATPLGLRAGLRTYLPAPVKNWLRVARERWYRNPSRDAA